MNQDTLVIGDVVRVIDIHTGEFHPTYEHNYVILDVHPTVPTAFRTYEEGNPDRVDAFFAYSLLRVRPSPPPPPKQMELF